MYSVENSQIKHNTMAGFNKNFKAWLLTGILCNHERMNKLILGV
jgi:hypothetical protein